MSIEHPVDSADRRAREALQAALYYAKDNVAGINAMCQVEGLPGDYSEENFDIVIQNLELEL